MKKYFTIIIILAFCINGYAQIPTLSGYHSNPIQSINTDEAFALITEWESLISTDLTIPPSTREEEIYKLLIAAEGGYTPIGNYDPNMGTWASGGLQHIMFRLKQTKNLNYVKAALYKADALLARRNDTISGEILPTTGKREHTWYGDESNNFNGPVRISYLNVGGVINRIAELSQWILDNPELHNQIAPFNPTIPMDTTVGDTYLERAEYYLGEVKKTITLFNQEGGYWKFNSTNNVGFYFNNTLDGITSLNAYRDSHSEEIPLDQFFSVMDKNDWWSLPYNRVFWFCDGYLRTAKALIKLDEINGTNLYTPFYDVAVDKVTSVGNYLLTFAQRHDEPSPLNKNLSWPYGSEQNHADRYEDNTHLDMDYEALEYLLDQDVFSDSARTILASSIFSRYFSFEHHVVYRLMDRSIQRDEIFNFPEHGADPYRPRGPAYGYVIGKHGAIEQVQGSLYKNLELLNESIREMQSPNIRKDRLERKDTRRGRTVIFPFEIHELKKAYLSRVNNTGNNNSPVFENIDPISVKQDVTLDSIIAVLSATDPDAGQKLHFWIAKDNIGGRFKINASSGEIRVNKNYPLNTELEDKYQLKVYVTDNGNPVKHDSITVQIDIVKTNSAPLVKPNQHYTASRNMVNGDHVAKVVVTDAENDSIKRYLLTTKDDLFRIDSNTGIISLQNANLIGQSSGSVRTLYVQVQDAGLPNIISGMEEVKITIRNRMVILNADSRQGEVPHKVDFSTNPVGNNNLSNYEWDFNNDGIIDNTGVSASYTYKKPGVYQATVYVQDNSGLKHAERVIIRVNEGEFIQPSDLIVHYDFAGDGYTVHDISGNNHHASVINKNKEYNIWRSGVINGGMAFPVGSELEIPNEVFDPIVSSKDFTISFWINDAKLRFNPILQAYDDNGKHVMDISSHLYADQMRLDITGSSFTEKVYQKLRSNVDLIRNGWTHWVFAKEASKRKLTIYVNGKKQTEDWAYNYPLNKTKYVRLGALPGIGEDNMIFSIDEFRMYSKALTPEEIDQLYFDISGKTNFPTSTKQINNTGRIRIFPNPASGIVNIHLPQKIKYQTVSLIDISGTLLKKQAILDENIVRLTLENIPTGLYLLKLDSKENTSISKLIIK